MIRPAFLALLLTVIRLSAAPVPLFHGKTFTGWEGDTVDIWRIEGGGLAAGSLERRLAKSEFLVTTKEFASFELTLKWKLEGIDLQKIEHSPSGRPFTVADKGKPVDELFA